MIDFPRSTFTWKSHPWAPDPYYKYAGGFVNEPGAIHHVRFNLEAKCQIHDEQNDHVLELFVGAPCRTEYTITTRNLFQIPNDEFRMAFSRTHQMPIAKRPSHEPEISTAIDLSQAFQEYQIQIRCHHDATELTTPQQVIDATLAHALLNARSAYQDAERGLSVVVEYPVNLINLNVAAGTFQVCTGPIILPDLSTWNGESVQRVFLAHVAFTQFDYVEFILRREVEAAPEERVWLDSVRGRDRLELHDPEERPPNYPPSRPRPLVYNETWGFDAQNVILQVPNQ